MNVEEWEAMRKDHNERQRTYLDMLIPNNDAWNKAIKKEAWENDIEIVEPHEVKLGSLDRKLAILNRGPQGLQVHVTASEEVIRNSPEFIEMLAKEAIDSLKLTIWKDDLYRANGLEWEEGK